MSPQVSPDIVVDDVDVRGRNVARDPHRLGGLLVENACRVPTLWAVAVDMEDALGFQEVPLKLRLGPALYARFGREAVPVHQPRPDPRAHVDRGPAAHQP